LEVGAKMSWESWNKSSKTGAYVGRHAQRRLGLAEALGVDAAGWFDGSCTFDAATARDIAEAIGADAPTVVGKALALALRRDAEDLA